MFPSFLWIYVSTIPLFSADNDINGRGEEDVVANLSEGCNGARLCVRLKMISLR